MNPRTILILVIAAIALTGTAIASDWQQFQKDEYIGWTTDVGPVIEPQLAWSYNVEGWVDTTPIVGDGQVFVLNATGMMYAFNAKTGVKNWNHQCAIATTGTFELSVPAYHDGIVYVATSKGALNQGFCRVSALHAISGDERENITLKKTGGYQLNTPITYADDRIYLGDWNGSSTTTNGTGTYWCLNASNVSDVLWNYTPDSSGCGYYWAGAAIVGDYVLFGDDNANVTCLNLTASCIRGTGVVKDYINVSKQWGSLYPVEEIRSSIVWNETTGRIYFTAKKADAYNSGHIYAVPFNSTTGDLGDNDAMGGGICDWSYQIGYSTSTPVVYGGRVYVGAGGMTGGGSGVTCLNESDGSWLRNTTNTTPAPGRVQASPAVSVWDGHVYIYFTTNTVTAHAYCFEDPGTGPNLTQRWRYTAGNNALQGMAISDGMVYYGSDGDYVYALQEGTPYDIDIDTSVALNGDVNISWSGNASREYDIFITDAYPNFKTTPAETGITVNHWTDADAAYRPKQRYYKVAYSGSAPGIVSDTVGYYNGSAKFGPDPDFTLLSVPHVINATDINDVLKYNHAPGQRLHGGLAFNSDYVHVRNPATGHWDSSWLSSSGTWSRSLDLSSDIGFKVYIRSGHTVPTNVVYRMLMRDTLGYLME